MSRRHDSNRQLCGTCQKIRFARFFNVLPNNTRVPDEEYRIGNLRHAFRAKACPFCKYIAQVAREKFPHVNDAQLRGYTYGLQRQSYGADDALQVPDMERKGYMVVTVWTDAADASSWLDLISLELCQNTPIDHEGHSYNARSAEMIRRPIPATFFSHAGLDIAKSWLKASEPVRDVAWEDSVMSQLLHDGRMRMIAVTPSPIVDLVVVREPVRYVALSYVWGNSVSAYASVNKAVYDQSRKQRGEGSTEVIAKIDKRKLPKKVWHAITVAKVFGERYIWVDALCISQQDADDKAAIIPCMGSIYGCATFTLIAADSPGANSGLRRCESSIESEEKPLRFRYTDSNGHGRKIRLLPACPSIDERIRESVWNTRGWTYQEHIMSRRCLIFTKAEVLFTCQMFRAREGFEVSTWGQQHEFSKPLGSAFDLQWNDMLLAHLLHQDGRQLERFEIIRLYAATLNAFSRRQLSHSSDRLNAYVGVLTRLAYEPLQQSERLALNGLLPGDMFYASLHWKHRQPTHEPAAMRRLSAAIMTEQLPSWSWAGWHGSIAIATNEDAALPLMPEMLDRYNIKCTAYDHGQPYYLEQWPMDYDLERSPGPCTVIHLWKPVIQCYITKYSLPNFYRRDNVVWKCNLLWPYGVRIDHDTGLAATIEIGSFLLRPTCPDQSELGRLYDVIVLDAEHVFFVKQVGEYWERILVGFGSKTAPGHDGIVFSPQIRPFYRHIKLI